MKRTYIVIAILLLLVSSIFFALSHRAKNTVETNSIPVPTPITINTKRLLPSNTPLVPTQPNLFENKTIKKELYLLENRQVLSSNDKAIKINLIALLQPDSESIYETSEYTILYIRPLDEFQVEIKTANTQQAKNNATTWVTSQGMSQDGICKLPLIFFTNHETYQKLQIQGAKDISPLADGC